LEGRDCDGMTVSTVNLHPGQEMRLPLCPLKQAGELAQRLGRVKNPLVVWATCRGGSKRLEWYTTGFEVIVPEEIALNPHEPTGS